jgi:hypothetical protein
LGAIVGAEVLDGNLYRRNVACEVFSALELGRPRRGTRNSRHCIQRFTKLRGWGNDSAERGRLIEIDAVDCFRVLIQILWYKQGSQCSVGTPSQFWRARRFVSLANCEQ